MHSNIAFTFILIYYSFLLFGTMINVKLTNIYFLLLNFFFLISVIVISYNFIPSSSLDLYRYYVILGRYELMDLAHNMEYGRYSNTFLTNIYFHLISKVSNRGFVSAIPTGITFSLILYTTLTFRKKFNCSFQAISFFMISIISVSSLIGIVSGLRQNLGWAVLMLAVYYDFFSDKKNFVIKGLLYLIPIMIHLSTVPFIAIRIITFYTKKFNFLKYLFLIWPLLVGLINTFYFRLPSVLQNSFEMLLFHTSYGSASITYKRLFAIIGYIIFLYFALNLKKISILNLSYNKSSEFLKFYISVIFFGISSIFIDFILFGRTMELVIYLSLPIMIELFRSNIFLKKFLVIILLFLYVFLFYTQDINSNYFFLN